MTTRQPLSQLDWISHGGTEKDKLEFGARTSVMIHGKFDPSQKQGHRCTHDTTVKVAFVHENV